MRGEKKIQVADSNHCLSPDQITKKNIGIGLSV